MKFLKPPVAKKPPMPKKAVKASSATSVRRMVVEPSDNGGFISRTEHASNRQPGEPYEEPKETKNVHSSVTALNAHIRRTFPPKPGTRVAAKGQPQWAGLMNQMMAEKGEK